MKRLVVVLLGLSLAFATSQQAIAYRPFDSTDAAVADVKELEIELGPVEYRQSHDERTVIAPAYVFNYGFVKNWELVVEGRGEYPLTSADDTSSRLVGNAINLKGVLREGDLQGQSGPSVATEIGVLLPGVNDEQGFGLSWIGIVSQRWSWGTAHINFGAELTRDHNTNLIAGTIIEGPFDWTVRPVAELRYERQVGFLKTDTLSALVGAIWKVNDKLSLDVGVREAWVNRLPQTELRAGLTVAFSPH
jgi:outer membrane receptor protein involved in Fe transport